MKSGVICIGTNLFETLLAISEVEQSMGLMYRDPPVPNMTFVYDHPQVNRFWMHATRVPLDIIFCYRDQVEQICVGQPYSTKMIGDDQLSDLVIELPFGTANAAGIKVGHTASLVRPSPTELKKIIAEVCPGIRKNYGDLTRW